MQSPGVGRQLPRDRKTDAAALFLVFGNLLNADPQGAVAGVRAVLGQRRADAGVTIGRQGKRSRTLKGREQRFRIRVGGVAGTEEQRP